MVVAQWCPTLCDTMDYSLPGSSVHGILEAKILKWVAIPFSRGSSRPRDRTPLSCVAGDTFPSEPQLPAFENSLRHSYGTFLPGFLWPVILFHLILSLYVVYLRVFLHA